MNEKTIAFVLVRDGLVNQKTNKQNYTEANDIASIKNTDKNIVKEVLKYLKINNVVANYQSTFEEERGHGFAFRINAELTTILVNDELIWQKINNLFKPINEIGQELAEFINTYKDVLGMNESYREALLICMQELERCYISQCYFACLALCNQVRAMLTNDIKSCPAYRAVPPPKIEITIPSQFRTAIEIIEVIHTLKAKSEEFSEKL